MSPVLTQVLTLATGLLTLMVIKCFSKDESNNCHSQVMCMYCAGCWLMGLEWRRMTWGELHCMTQQNMDNLRCVLRIMRACSLNTTVLCKVKNHIKKNRKGSLGPRLGQMSHFLSPLLLTRLSRFWWQQVWTLILMTLTDWLQLTWQKNVDTKHVPTSSTVVRTNHQSYQTIQ